MRKRGARFHRRIDPCAGLHAISMQHALDASQKTDLGCALHVSLEALRTGQASEQEFHTLAAAVNVSLVLCERDIGNEHLPAIKQAQASLLRLLERGRTTGRWLFDGQAWKECSHAIAIHEAQLASVSRQQAANAMREVVRRIDNGNVFDEVRV